VLGDELRRGRLAERADRLRRGGRDEPELALAVAQVARRLLRVLVLLLELV
jgi:hypothetical protein